VQYKRCPSYKVLRSDRAPFTAIRASVFHLSWTLWNRSTIQNNMFRLSPRGSIASGRCSSFEPHLSMRKPAVLFLCTPRGLCHLVFGWLTIICAIIIKHGCLTLNAELALPQDQLERRENKNAASEQIQTLAKTARLPTSYCITTRSTSTQVQLGIGEVAVGHHIGSVSTNTKIKRSAGSVGTIKKVLGADNTEAQWCWVP